MIREVGVGLSTRPRSIPPKYFYDAAGSRLFDAICELPEYYLTRSERALLEQYADRIVGRTGARSLVELGSGMARKTGPLARALCDRHPARRSTFPFDIAPEAIDASARSLLAEHPTLRVCGVVGDFARDFGRLAAHVSTLEGPRLFAFLGSTIGNFDDRAAPALLRSIAQMMTDGDRFLLGIDLVKDARILHAAYNDAQGVTAAFNKNVLRVLARELDGDIDDRSFEHLAFYDEALQRIEMHLVSMRPQTMTLRAADVRDRARDGRADHDGDQPQVHTVHRRADAVARRHANGRVDPGRQRHVRAVRRAPRLPSRSLRSAAVARRS